MATAPRNPAPAYRGSPAIYGDKELYARLGKIVEGHQEEQVKKGGDAKGLLELVENFLIPIRSGKAWVVKKGQLCTLSTPQGPQVGDLNIFSLHNPREHFWASRTKQLHAAHVSVGDRLWSNLPYMRPLVTIVADSLKDYGVDGSGVDEVGGRCHDLLGTRCDPYINRLLSGDDFDFQCHSNLTRALLPFGLTEDDVHDVINVFQVTGLNQDDKYFMEPSPAKPTDYFTFFAETDILCAMSTCPGGDLSVFGWGQDSAKRMLDTCRPLGVAVYEIQEGLKEEVLRGWKESERPAYKGMHGLKIPVFGE